MPQHNKNLWWQDILQLIVAALPNAHHAHKQTCKEIGGKEKTYAKARMVIDSSYLT